MMRISLFPTRSSKLLSSKLLSSKLLSSKLLPSTLLLFAGTTLGCAKQTDASTRPAARQAQDAPERIREVPGPVEGQIIVEVDINGDGRPQVWNVYRELESGGRLRVRKDTDLDGDGKPDVISEFDEKGQLVRERMDGDFDGTFEWVDHYRNGRRVFTEVDTTRNGTSDLFYYYGTEAESEGVLERRERDTNGDGRIDLWERYGEDGTLLISARDTTGDGKPDVRNE